MSELERLNKEINYFMKMWIEDGDDIALKLVTRLSKQREQLMKPRRLRKND